MTGGTSSQQTFEPRGLVEQQLESDEQVVWWGRPRSSAMVRLSLRRDRVFFGVLCICVAMLAAVTIYRDVRDGKDVNWPASAVGVVFVGVGVWLVMSPLWARRRAKKTVYALTDRRAMIITVGRHTTVRSLGPGDLEEVPIKRQRRDGSGDLVLQRRVSYYAGGRGTRQRVVETGFFGVEDVDEVEKKFRELIRKWSDERSRNSQGDRDDSTAEARPAVG